jgi:hypothetical protein
VQHEVYYFLAIDVFPHPGLVLNKPVRGCQH